MTIRLLFVLDALDAAERVLRAPDRNAVRMSVDERVSLCALALQQHEVIVAHGLAAAAYPRPPAAPPPEAPGPVR